MYIYTLNTLYYLVTIMHNNVKQYIKHEQRLLGTCTQYIYIHVCVCMCVCVYIYRLTRPYT